jgi:hypothetical protein
MILQKQLSRKVGDKEYAKYVLVISSEVVKKVGWKGGQEIQAEVKRKSVLLKTGK